MAVALFGAVRIAGAEEPKKAADDPVVAGLIDVINDKDQPREKRIKACTKLADLGAKAKPGAAAMGAYFVELLSTGKKVGNLDLGATNEQGLRDLDVTAKRHFVVPAEEVLDALVKVGADADDAVPEITKILACRTIHLRFDDSQAIGGEGGRELRFDDTRRKIVQVLGNVGGDRVVPPLLKVLEEDSPPSIEAAQALGRLRARDAVPGLLKLLKKSEHAEMRAASAEALGKIGSKEALPALTAAEMLEEDGKALAAVKAAIKAIGDK
jgi:HEAT repeat protein